MSNKILLRRSSTVGAVPSSDQIVLGELVINAADGKVYLKRTDSVIVCVGQAAVKSSAGVNDAGKPIAINNDGFLNKALIDWSDIKLGKLAHQGSQLGFYNATPINKPTVTGSRVTGTAFTSLLSALTQLGLIQNSST